MTIVSDEAKGRILEKQLALAEEAARELGVGPDMVAALVHREDLNMQALPGADRPILWVEPERFWAPSLRVSVVRATSRSTKPRRAASQAGEPCNQIAQDCARASAGAGLGDILGAALARAARNEAAS
jgi:hypothetical protein